MAAIYIPFIMYLSYQSTPLKLPDFPQNFTGREAECDNILRYITKEKVKVIAITGGPGFGKSSLSIVAGYELANLAKQVWHISLSDVDSIDSFILKLMGTFTNKKLEAADKTQLYNWLSSISYETVLILDNVDRLTLNDSTVRSEFQLLLKNMVDQNKKVKYIVTTRFRLEYTDYFEEIHILALDVDQGGQLLLKLSTSTSREAMVEEESSIIQDLENIANLTGGVPLAIKIVGRLLKSGQLSISEVHKELSVDPIGALSLERFSPDEQLNRCFNLSIQSLSKIGRKCFFTTSLFPGTFDKAARDIIFNIIEDRHCVDQLIDRSLLEYDIQSKRYSMHSLLQEFANDFLRNNGSIELKMAFLSTFMKHYMSQLEHAYHSAQSTRNYKVLYSSLIFERHNLVSLMTEFTRYTIDVDVGDMLVFAENMFDIMKASFPGEVLLRFWMTVQHNNCQTKSFNRLCSYYLRLTTKLGKLLLRYKKFTESISVLESGWKCIYNTKEPRLAQEYLYLPLHKPEDGIALVSFLQTLKKAYKTVNNSHMVNETRKALYSFLTTVALNIEILYGYFLEDFCTDGIEYLQYGWKEFGRFNNIYQLLLGLMRCDETQYMLSLLPETTSLFSMQGGEESVSSVEIAVARVKMAGICDKMGNKECEIENLEHAIASAEKSNSNSIAFLYKAHSQLSTLYNSIQIDKIYEHALAAYNYSVILYKEQGDPCFSFSATIVLGNILLNSDFKPGADKYFEEALEHLQLCLATDRYNPQKGHQYQQFIEEQLIQYYLKKGKYIQALRHYGQWAILDYSRYFNKFLENLEGSNDTGTEVTLIDSSLKDSNEEPLRKIIKHFQNKADSLKKRVHNCTAWFSMLVVGIVLFICMPICYCVLCPFYYKTLSIFTLCINTTLRMLIKGVYYFHYFLYRAILNCKLIFPTNFVHEGLNPPVLNILYTYTNVISVSFVVFMSLHTLLNSYSDVKLVLHYFFPIEDSTYPFTHFNYQVFVNQTVNF